MTGVVGPALAGCAAFARLGEDQRATVAGLAREVAFAGGDRLFDEGRPAVGCWVLRSGRVRLETPVPAREPVVLQSLGPGELVGWSWLVGPRFWRVRAVADGPVTAVELDTVRLTAAAEADPALGYALALGLLESAVDRLQHTRARLLDVYRSPRDR